MAWSAPEAKAAPPGRPNVLLIAVDDLKPASGLSGVSLSPMLNDPSARVREFVVSQYPRRHQGEWLMGCALRDERYRYIAWREIDVLRAPPGETAAEEPYDYLEGPCESAKLIDRPTYRSVADRMRERSGLVGVGRTASSVELAR